METSRRQFVMGSAGAIVSLFLPIEFFKQPKQLKQASFAQWMGMEAERFFARLMHPESYMRVGNSYGFYQEIAPVILGEVMEWVPSTNQVENTQTVAFPLHEGPDIVISDLYIMDKYHQLIIKTPLAKSKTIIRGDVFMFTRGNIFLTYC